MSQDQSSGVLPAADTKKSTAALKKTSMSLIGVVALIFSFVAAGAFGIEEAISASGPGLTLIMLVVFPFIWAFPLSEMVGELGSLYPTEGGIYSWARESLGEFWGWQAGFWSGISTWLCQAQYCALVAGYAAKYIPMSETTEYLVKLAVVLVFTIINIIGLESLEKLETVFTVIVIIAFVAVTVVGLINWNYNPVTPIYNEDEGVLHSIGGGISIIIWMYCGYECVSNMAGEIENPEVIPKGFRIAMPMIAASYILPTIAGLVSLGRWDEWGTDGIGYGDVLTEFLGYGWGVAFLVIAILSQAAIFNSYIAAGSRGFFVMADDRLCPKFLVKVSKKRGVPVLSILLLGVFTAVMMNFDFSTLLVIVGPLALMIYVVLGIALLIIRKKYPVDSRDCWYIRGGNIKVKLYAFVPMIIAVIALLVNGTEYFLLGFVSIGSGLAAYIVFKLIYGGLYKIDSQKYPINPKTKFAKGDITRFGVFILSFGVYALAGSFFLQWYEGSWGPEYYLEMYESGLISDFAAMINVARVGGAVGTAAGTLLLLIGIKKDPAR